MSSAAIRIPLLGTLQVLAGMGQQDEARRVINACRDLYGSHADVDVGGRQSFAEGLPTRTLANVHLDFSRGFMAINDPASAVNASSRALTLDPNIAEAHVIRGHAHAMLAQWTEALESIASARSLSPQDPGIAELQRDVRMQATRAGYRAAPREKSKESPGANQEQKSKKKKPKKKRAAMASDPE